MKFRPRGAQFHKAYKHKNLLSTGKSWLAKTGYYATFHQVYIVATGAPSIFSPHWYFRQMTHSDWSHHTIALFSKQSLSVYSPPQDYPISLITSSLLLHYFSVKDQQSCIDPWAFYIWQANLSEGKTIFLFFLFRWPIMGDAHWQNIHYSNWFEWFCS